MPLPIISSGSVDAFDDEGNRKYVYRIKDDASPLTLPDIIRFYSALTENKSRKQPAGEIKEAAEKVCDLKYTLTKVIDYFREE